MQHHGKGLLGLHAFAAALAHAWHLAAQSYLVQRVFCAQLTQQHIALALGMQGERSGGAQARQQCARRDQFGARRVDNQRCRFHPRQIFRRDDAAGFDVMLIETFDRLEISFRFMFVGLD